tara:strand:+ start:209 stop:886 length:678 start_codon:yes stop_codon:yes gene_type:complete
MNNRFNINEQEKNRIRGLHKNYSIIKEQSEERSKISKEDYDTIMKKLYSKLQTYRGKTVNLWTTTIDGEETADGPGTVAGDEVSSLGSWSIDYIAQYSELDEDAGEDYGSIIIDFKFRANPEDESQNDVMNTFIKAYGDSNGNLSVIWECGDKDFVTDTAATSSETGRLPGTFTNLKLINKLNSELCNSKEWKEYDNLFSPNGNAIVTDMDVDFSMGDEDTETLA